MKIATWNANSVRSRLPRLLAWLQKVQPDVVCLQETKVTDDEFPFEAIREAGCHAAAYGQKTCNGVAILGRRLSTCRATQKARSVSIGLPDGMGLPADKAPAMDALRRQRLLPSRCSDFSRRQCLS